MIEQVEALRALAECGTTARAAARLRITQSAVSKRIASLEAHVGRSLVERVGRGCRVTPEGVSLLEDLTPLLVAMSERLAASRAAPATTIQLAASESMLASWLPPLLRHASLAAGVELDVHAHRGTNVLNRLRTGDVDVAITAEGDGDSALAVDTLGTEPMVVVTSSLGLLPDDDPLPVCTIEAASLTGAWLDRRLARLRYTGGRRLVPTRRIESFAAALGLARGGFGHALVPAGLAAGLPSHAIPGLERPVVVTTRPSARQRPAIASFIEALRGGWSASAWIPGGS